MFFWWGPPDCPFLDPTLLFAAKKNGVEKRTVWQVSSRKNWPLGHDQTVAQKAPAHSKNKKQGGFRRPTPKIILVRSHSPPSGD